MTPMAIGDRVPNHPNPSGDRTSPANAWRRADRLANYLREQGTSPLKSWSADLYALMNPLRSAT
jgi:hypothetical protein